MQELCCILQIQQNIFAAYHPCMDSQSKWTNQWLEHYLHFWANEQQDKWAAHLPMAEFTHNNTLSSAMKQTLFFTLIGYHPRDKWNLAKVTLLQSETRLLQCLQA
jgi:hypothetical protein